MPRIRTVKPEYPQHRKARKVSRDARLLNIHLWNLADDEGRLQELVPWIIGAVFPGDEDVTPAVLRGWLEELERVKLIIRYEVDGERYIQCHDWDDHQRIEKPKDSDLPPPPNGPVEPIRDESGNDPGNIQDESPLERKGREQGTGKGREGTRAGASPPSEYDAILRQLDRVIFGRSLPGLKVPAAIKACRDFQDRDLAIEAGNFAHYWIDGRGEKRPLKDVVGAWRSWLHRAPKAGEIKVHAGERSGLTAIDGGAADENSPYGNKVIRSGK